MFFFSKPFFDPHERYWFYQCNLIFFSFSAFFFFLFFQLFCLFHLFRIFHIIFVSLDIVKEIFFTCIYFIHFCKPDPNLFTSFSFTKIRAGCLMFITQCIYVENINFCGLTKSNIDPRVKPVCKIMKKK